MSSSSPCAACKCLRRKCTQECVFAPYFPPENPQKFLNVHKVYGASNVAKLLNDLDANNREDAVNSLAYEAEYRLRDPIYGCVGLISVLQQKLKHAQTDLAAAKKELAGYLGNPRLFPLVQQYLMHQHPNNPSTSNMMQYAVQPILSMQPVIPAANGGQLMIHDPQQMFEAQQMAFAADSDREQQDILRNYVHHLPEADRAGRMRFNSGFDNAGAATATAPNQMPSAAAAGAGLSSSPAVFGTYECFPYYHIQQPSPDNSHSYLQAHHHQYQQQNYLPEAQLQSLQQQQQKYPPDKQLQSLQQQKYPPDEQLQSLQQQQQQQQNYLADVQLQSLQLQQQPQPQPQPQRSKSEEGRNIGLPC